MIQALNLKIKFQGSLLQFLKEIKERGFAHPKVPGNDNFLTDHCGSALKGLIK